MKPYEPPQLHVLGSLRELTHKSGSSLDGGTQVNDQVFLTEEEKEIYAEKGYNF